MKKLKATNNSKAEMEFAVEVEVLARVRHKNLLGLRGYCAGADQRMIVYDYMPNLSLLSHLHGQFAGEVRLDWKRRVAVAVGSAEGLVYLHHEVAPHIIHRDIKASNVLLDSDFAPLVADFGFAKLVPEGVSHMTTRAKRTITEWAEPLIARGRLGDLVDPRLRGAFDAAQLARAVECAALCVQGEPDRRPDMKTVVRILRGDNNAGAAAAAAAIVGRGGSKGDLQQMQMPVRMESVKYADRLMEMDKSSSYYGEPEDGDEDEQEEEDDDDEVEEYSLIDDKSSMNFGAFGAMPVQTMQDPYIKRFSGNVNAIKI